MMMMYQAVHALSSINNNNPNYHNNHHVRRSILSPPSSSSSVTTLSRNFVSPNSIMSASASATANTARKRRITSNPSDNKAFTFGINLFKSNRRFSASLSAGASDSSSPPPTKELERQGPDLQTLLRRFWKVAAPYWSSPDEKVQARLQLAAVFALTLATTGISVGFSFLGRDFYNALANKDQEQFSKQLLYYLGAFAGGIPLFVLSDYAREVLSLKWRSWMTTYYIDRYLKNQTFYKIQSQSIVDNPDQRIVDDLSSFTGTALSFSLTLFNAAVDLISFSNILFGIYPPIFVVLLVYSIGGTALSVYLGKGLISLNFLQEKKEADFRYGLVRVRENAESIAFYEGEENEMQLLLQRFRSAFENLSQLLVSSRNLEFLTSGYRYLIQILPVAVVAPMYFSGKIDFGVINQSVSAFNHILGDFSLIVYQFQAISAFSAVIDRLGEFDDVLDKTSSDDLSAVEEISLQYCKLKSSSSIESNGSTPGEMCASILNIENLTLETPTNKATLINDLSINVKENDYLLIMGPSGSGKTSLLRALAGLWSAGAGKITFYLKDSEYPEPTISSDIACIETTDEITSFAKSKRPDNHKSRGIFFLPQRPYMVLGTLRQQLLYPTWSDDATTTAPDPNIPDDSSPVLVSDMERVREKLTKPTTEDIIQVLKDVCLENILSRFSSLDVTNEWSSVLSLGEQQRLAFARLILSKPKLALLDEATSALDEANEANLYKQIQAAGIAYISIGHRRTLYEYHNRILRISTINPTSSKINWNIESIDPGTTKLDMTKL